MNKNTDWDHAVNQIFKMIGYDWGKPLDRYLYEYIEYLNETDDSAYQKQLDQLNRLKELNKKGIDKTSSNEDITEAMKAVMGAASSIPSAVLLRVLARELLTYAPEGTLKKSMSQKPLRAWKAKHSPDFMKSRFALVTRTTALFGGDTTVKVFRVFGIG